MWMQRWEIEVRKSRIPLGLTFHGKRGEVYPRIYQSENERFRRGLTPGPIWVIPRIITDNVPEFTEIRFVIHPFVRRHIRKPLKCRIQHYDYDVFRPGWPRGVEEIEITPNYYILHEYYMEDCLVAWFEIEGERFVIDDIQ